MYILLASKERSGERNKEREEGRGRDIACSTFGNISYSINTPLKTLREVKCEPHSTSPTTDTEVNGSTGVLGTLSRIWMENRQ